jgi:carbamoyltransferase
MNFQTHTSTQHDASIAYEEGDELHVLLAERVNREKHSFDYERLAAIFQQRAWHIMQGAPTPLSEMVQYDPFQYVHHHLAHAACSYFTSNFKSSVILIADGMGPYKNGDFSSTSLWFANGNSLELLGIDKEKEFCFNSLGHLYSAITYYCGFSFWHEGKTMWLAPYGAPSDISEKLEWLVTFGADWGFTIDKQFIGFCFSLKYLDDSFFDEFRKPEICNYYENLFGPVRGDKEIIRKSHENLAWAWQNMLERLMVHVVANLKKMTGGDNLCLWWWVALNSVANSKIIRTKLFDDVYIPPCCWDDWQAIWKLLYHKHVTNGATERKPLKSAYLWIQYSDKEIIEALEQYSSELSYTEYPSAEIVSNAADLLADWKIIGWFQWRSEIWPRALWHRSILADPRKHEMKDIINERVKHREAFRPFAPSILQEHLDDYFADGKESRFMLEIFEAKKRALENIPATIHVDGTARVQTVTKEDNDMYYDLIKAFHTLTWIPVVLNTSFNDNEEPIVETPADAVRAFVRLDLDVLVIGRFICHKKLTP